MRVVAALFVLISAGSCSAVFDFKEGLSCEGPSECLSGYVCYLGKCRDKAPKPCGNYRLDADEVCDDGNHADGDGCSADCTSDETCGNGFVDAAVGEVCDDAAQNGIYGKCSADCARVMECGDGVVDVPDEICDDGAANGDYDACKVDCSGHGPTCGDGTVDEPDEVW